MNSLSVLILLQIPTLKNKTIQKILSNYIAIPTCTLKLMDFLNELSDSYIKIPSIEIIKVAILEGKKIFKECENSGISIMNYSENIFPQKLKTIPYPPLLLYYKGNVKCLNENYNAAIIGTRLPSQRGKLISKKLGSIFALKGFVVVSGLALGCDTYGHLGSLEKGGNNIAVLACGLNNIYPRQNIKLSDKIIANGGCLISEYPPNINVKPQFFILRDRLESGLSSIVTIIETNINGGTMHTAKFALNQDKILVCVSPSLLGGVSGSNKGNSQLIENKMAIELINFQNLEELIEEILSNCLKPIFKTKMKEQLRYEQLKFNL